MAIAEEPKRPANAYWLFLAENREALTKEAGSNSGPAVGKVAGAKWKAMTEAAKAPFEKRAAAAKAQYEKDMEAFKAGGGEVGKRRAEKAEAKGKRDAKRARKAAIDPNKPKKPPSGYWLWLADNRAALMVEVEKKTGKKNVAEVAKLGGQRFKALTEKAKAPFEKKAAELKKKYDEEMAEYKKNNADAGDDDDDEDEDGEEEA